MRADWLVRLDVGGPRFDGTAKPGASPAELAARLAARIAARATQAPQKRAPHAPADRRGARSA